jgi:putative cardiolipin synthase
MLALLLFSAFLGACAILPPHPSEPVTRAVEPDAKAPIGVIANAALGDDPRSGFRLLPVAWGSYQTRIELINQAKHSLDLQYYLFQGDDTGRFMMRALRQAAERGVRVRILIDDLYTSGEDPLLNALNSFPNVEIRLFNPFAAGRGALWSRFAFTLSQTGREDHRMHNKLFLVDNEAAVAGGRNIADEYFMRSANNNFIDTDIFAIGPVVQQLSDIFDRYWNSDFAFPLRSVTLAEGTTEELQRRFDELTIYAIAPPPEAVPDSARSYLSLPEELRRGRITQIIHANAQAVADPVNKASGANLTDIKGTVTSHILDMIASARQSVVMASPYFVPGKAGLKRLQEASARGIDQTVITNSLASTDEPLAEIGYIRYRRALLEAGVHIREMSPTLVVKSGKLGIFHGSLGALHAKIAVVDGHLVYIGSMNLDERSAFENTELGLIIDSKELADELDARTDRASSYALRLGKSGAIEWVAEQNGKEVVFDDEPEAGIWTRIEVKLLAPFVPENQL